MSERTQLVEMARDVYKNRFSHSKYTKEDACEALRNKLVDLNGGSTILDYKAFRRNKTDMFEIIEYSYRNRAGRLLMIISSGSLLNLRT